MLRSATSIYLLIKINIDGLRGRPPPHIGSNRLCADGEGFINDVCTTCPKDTYSTVLGLPQSRYSICSSCPENTCTQSTGSVGSSSCSAEYCD